MQLEVLRAVELFAGVGGFRLGLERVLVENQPKYEVVWSNQWEPSTRTQHASDIYVKRFGAIGHSNVDITSISSSDLPPHDVLVGGFPCQDYSVARTLNQSQGLAGKKGVLWWEIHRLLRGLGANRPKYLLLENVDRLIKSPASQRGRDFGVMLASLLDLGYSVEWRVINSADYGMPQRRKRVFIVGYHDASPVGREIASAPSESWLLKTGVIGRAFPGVKSGHRSGQTLRLVGNLADISETFGLGAATSPFNSAGVAWMKDSNRIVKTFDIEPVYHGERAVLRDVLDKEEHIPSDFFLTPGELEQWKYLKGAKAIRRVSRATQHEYCYQEGRMTFPDDISKPSRTIVTGEGGRAASRFKHVIQTSSGRYRRLTPVELERLNMFPDNHTEGVSDTRRAFLMGNALVVGLVTRLAESLFQHHSQDLTADEFAHNVVQPNLFPDA